MINKIIEETGVKIDIEDDGRVFIYSTDTQNAQKAMNMILDVAKVIEVGQIYEGTVTRIMPFGAFIDLGGGNEGLLHISKISHHRVDKVEDVLKLGDIIDVKVTEIDNKGRINVSAKAFFLKPKTEEEKTAEYPTVCIIIRQCTYGHSHCKEYTVFPCPVFSQIRAPCIQDHGCCQQCQ